MTKSTVEMAQARIFDVLRLRHQELSVGKTEEECNSTDFRIEGEDDPMNNLLHSIATKPLEYNLVDTEGVLKSINAAIEDIELWQIRNKSDTEEFKQKYETMRNSFMKVELFDFDPQNYKSIEDIDRGIEIMESKFQNMKGGFDAEKLNIPKTVKIHSVTEDGDMTIYEIYEARFRSNNSKECIDLEDIGDAFELENQLVDYNDELDLMLGKFG